MNKIYICIVGILFILFSSCESDIEMIHIQEGIPSEVISDADPDTPIILLKEDEQNIVYNLNWTVANYLGEDAVSSVKGEYIIEMSTSEDFSNATTIHPPEYLTHGFQGIALNTILIEQFGALPEEPIETFFRIESTFNKDALNSNTISNTFIPYRLKELPAVYLPPNGIILIAGPAAGNPWPLETKFTQITETLYSLETHLIGGEAYEFVTDGNWSQAYHIPADVVPADVATAGTFVEDGNQAHDEYGNEVSRWEGQNFLSPPEDGTYTITLDFQAGTYTVEPGPKPAVYLPPNGTILIAGPAAGNPWPLETEFTQITETLYSLETNLIGGEAYEFVTDGNWSQAYHIPADVVPADVATEGSFVEDGGKAHDESGNEVERWEGQNFLSPPEDGTYSITLDFQSGTYTVVKQ